MIHAVTLASEILHKLIAIFACKRMCRQLLHVNILVLHLSKSVSFKSFFNLVVKLSRMLRKLMTKAYFSKRA